MQLQPGPQLGVESVLFGQALVKKKMATGSIFVRDKKYQTSYLSILVFRLRLDLTFAQDQTDGAAACAMDLAVFQLNAGASDIFLVFELVKTIRNEAKVFGPKGAY